MYSLSLVRVCCPQKSISDLHRPFTHVIIEHVAQYINPHNLIVNIEDPYFDYEYNVIVCYCTITVCLLQIITD